MAISKEKKAEYNRKHREKKKIEAEKTPIESDSPINGIMEVTPTLPEKQEPTQVTESDSVTISKAELYAIFDKLSELEKAEKKEIVVPAEESKPSYLSMLGESIMTNLVNSAGSLALPLLLMGASSMLPSLQQSLQQSTAPTTAYAKQEEKPVQQFAIPTMNLY